MAFLVVMKGRDELSFLAGVLQEASCYHFRQLILEWVGRVELFGRSLSDFVLPYRQLVLSE